MNRSDLPLFAERLNALSEVFGKPAVSVKAMEVWFDVLKEFPAERVMDVLNGWAKFNGRFPAPAQVWEKVNSIQIDNREAKAAFERAQNTAPAREIYATSPRIEAICEHWRKVLGTKAPMRVERIPGEDDEKVAA